jgi:hypothetical protein
MNPGKLNPFLVEKATSGSDCTTGGSCFSARHAPEWSNA